MLGPAKKDTKKTCSKMNVPTIHNEAEIGEVDDCFICAVSGYLCSALEEKNTHTWSCQSTLSWYFIVLEMATTT